ncbi:MAG: DUF1887 family CARF protein [Campylobacterales bacterium]
MILVSIVGDFYSSVLPLFYEFRHKITKHIIVYDDFKNDVVCARKIIEGTDKFIKKHNLAIESIPIKIDEDSLDAIKKVSKFIHGHCLEYDELYINITDGLANVGFLLSQEFISKGVNILTYDRYDNEYNVLTKDTMNTYQMKSSIPIKEHFLLKNVDIVSTQDISFADRYEDELNIFFEKYEADNKEFHKQHFKNIPKGFLYEYYVYNLVKKLDFDDVLMGVKVRDNRLDDIYLENEYDILLMKNNHLHMIECKYLKILDTTALLYKLDSVRESLDEDANILIVTDFDKYNEIEHIPNELITPYYKRAFAKKIYLRGSPTKHIVEFMKDADKIFSFKTANIESIYQSKKSYNSVKEPIRRSMIKEVVRYLKDRLEVDMNLLDAKDIARLLQYKTNKQLSQKTKYEMEDAQVRYILTLMQKMLISKQEYISVYDIYYYYKDNLLD